MDRMLGNLMRHMALHDPDSSVQEKAMALKFGRQRKIQVIDGQQVRDICTILADQNLIGTYFFSHFLFFSGENHVFFFFKYQSSFIM